MAEVKFPKYVKAADQWCVTIVVPGKDKPTYTQHWFSILGEAMKFYEEKK